VVKFAPTKAPPWREGVQFALTLGLQKDERLKDESAGRKDQKETNFITLDVLDWTKISQLWVIPTFYSLGKAILRNKLQRHENAPVYHIARCSLSIFATEFF
jgi:hypothetical protein